MIFKINVINPYGIGNFILFSYSEAPYDLATWILHDGKGKEIKHGKGHSRHSINHSLVDQADINGQAYARRYIMKTYPMLCGKVK